ncbi:hypothetical protein QCM80_43435 [Bradyrhizobium sp. SSUT112]|uniref:hypothetical protein n=1 Tax=Bradyrhizobium sp. SSUT112 TaxID=3040604 RepID=UPI00244C56A1|nr:hypothetical protein [Bradyrhizobium sp. SSUT112]MDH2357358.1 hypothetical protein [Bradyrhizobium sp. SSUT112]
MTPHVRIAVDAIPGAIEKNREALLLLLCADEIRLISTFLGRATNNHPNPDYGHDRKQKADRVCNPLDRSQNRHDVAPGCLTLAD